jgi:hypothetical protein
VVKSAPFASRELDSIRVEMHGDVAITYRDDTSRG